MICDTFVLSYHALPESDASCRERLSEICTELISPPRRRKADSESGAGGAGDSAPDLTADERKKRAKEMQARLMADMAKKQQVLA